MLNTILKELRAGDRARGYKLSPLLVSACAIIKELKEIEAAPALSNKIIMADDTGDEREFKYIEGGNSYNWSGCIDHDYDFRIYERERGERFMVIKFHISGDVRCNYTYEAVLHYDDWSRERFYDAILNNDKTGRLSIGSYDYYYTVSALSEGVNISRDGGSDFEVFPDDLTVKDIRRAIIQKIK